MWDSVEFRRIVVAAGDRGNVQLAIGLLGNYCGNELKLQRIWLDVFARYDRGRRIYEKRGYREFDQRGNGTDKLVYYDKKVITRANAVCTV